MRRLIDRCAGIDVGQALLVVCVRVVDSSRLVEEVRSFGATTPDLLALRDWLVRRWRSPCAYRRRTGRGAKAVDADTDSHEREPPDSQDDGCDRLELSGI
jgi:hypothetical protein